MKKILSISLLLSVTFLGTLAFTSAHPGNTSRDGCHYCKTNCKKRGYTYNTRHCKYGKVPQFGVADPKYYYKKK